MDLDERYHEYLWGEPSARAFAKACRRGPLRLQVVLDPTIDPAFTISA